MAIKKAVGANLLLISLTISGSALASVTAEEAARLDGDLTPMGAERAGNADGSIPEWTGGLQGPPEGISIGENLHRPDPFANDEVLFTITSDNYLDYADSLMPSSVSLFENVPGFYMNVYPSRRSCSLPQFVYDSIRQNALNADLVSDGNGVSGATMATPFPFPTEGQHVVWNHTLRYRGFRSLRQFASAAPSNSGDFTPVIVQDQAVFLYSDPNLENFDDLNNISLKYLQTVIAPSRRAGAIILVHETINQGAGARNAWTYNPGMRRVRRAPTIAYDNPQSYSDGLSTADQLDMYNGSPDRYEWVLVGKDEYIIPYNVYDLASPEHQYTDIATPGHINQDLIRYERHRVWTAEGNLVDGARHIYSRRVHFHDEDTYQIVGAQLYDSRGELWRIMEAYMINFYDVPLCFTIGEISYDLQNGRYSVQGLVNQEPGIDFEGTFTEGDFNPDAMRRGGIR